MSEHHDAPTVWDHNKIASEDGVVEPRFEIRIRAAEEFSRLHGTRTTAEKACIRLIRVLEPDGFALRVPGVIRAPKKHLALHRGLLALHFQASLRDKGLHRLSRQ